MPPPLSMDLRNRIIAAYEAGEGSLRGFAKRFDVGPATTNRLWSRYKIKGNGARHQRRPEHGV